MAHLFVSQGQDDIPRWRKAFSTARVVRPQQARAWSGPGDQVWVMSNIVDWPLLVATLSSRGATVVVLSYAPETSQALQALSAGARGYIHAISPVELFRQVALVTVNQGIWVPSELLGKVVGATFKALGGAEQLRQDALSALTARERGVAMAVAEGHSNKEIARRLDITERTVKAHLSSIFRKLGVRDRMQLILRLSPSESSVLDVDR